MMDLEEINLRDDDGCLTGHIQVYGAQHRITMIQVAWARNPMGDVVHRSSDECWYDEFHLQVAANDEWQSTLVDRHRLLGSITLETLFHDEKEYVLFIDPEPA